MVRKKELMYTINDELNRQISANKGQRCLLAKRNFADKQYTVVDNLFLPIMNLFA